MKLAFLWGYCDSKTTSLPRAFACCHICKMNQCRFGTISSYRLLHNVEKRVLKGKRTSPRLCFTVVNRSVFFLSTVPSYEQQHKVSFWFAGFALSALTIKLCFSVAFTCRNAFRDFVEKTCHVAFCRAIMYIAFDCRRVWFFARIVYKFGIKLRVSGLHFQIVGSSKAWSTTTSRTRPGTGPVRMQINAHTLCLRF